MNGEAVIYFEQLLPHSVKRDCKLFLSLVKKLLAVYPEFEEGVVDCYGLPFNVDYVFLEQRFLYRIHVC